MIWRYGADLIRDDRDMSEWPLHILSFSAQYWELKVRSPDKHSTMEDQLFYKKAAAQAREELQRRAVTEILLK